MKRFFLGLIRFYQKNLSGNGSWAKVLFLTDKACRFTPSCSEYTYEAIEKYGIIKGMWLGIKRILHCHPLNKGGDDPLR